MDRLRDVREMQAERIVSNSTDNLKKAAFGLMAILFVINISTMANADRGETAELNPMTNEIETLRMTASNLQATQSELLEEISRLQSKIRAIKIQQDSVAADQNLNSTLTNSERP